MILVTGAGGKTGRAVVAALAGRDAAVRALVRRADHVPALRALGAQEVIVGDLLDEQDRQRAARGARSIYHLCPNVHPDEEAIGRGMIAAACDAGIEHFVFHSVLYPQVEAMPHHWRKLRVEEALLCSGLAFTILQPAAYMQNLLASWPAMAQEGVLRVPYDTDTRMTLVDLRDVAQVAATVTTEAGHTAAILPLCGTEALDQHQIAATLAQAIGRPVRAERVALDVWRREATLRGVPAHQVDTLCRMFAWYDEHDFCGHAGPLATLLGRQPTTVGDFAARHRDRVSSRNARH